MKRFAAILAIMLLACNKDNDVFDPPIIDEINQLVFISQRISDTGEWQLFSINSDGSGERKLTDDKVTCYAPAVSPDGQHIAYTTFPNYTSYKLWVIDRNGENKQLLSEGERITGMTWAPDNQTIAFVKSSPDYHIYTTNIISATEKQVTSGSFDYWPAFLDNNTLLYTSNAGGNNSGIFSLNLSTGTSKLLTPSGSSFAAPCISPDKKMIALIQPSWEGSQIFTMKADGSHLKQITHSVSPQYFDTGFPRDANSDPQWSPDSKRLAYVSYSVNGTPDIFVVDADGRNNTMLTEGIVRDEHPIWTANGSHIIFMSNSNPSRNTELYIMDRKGNNVRPFTTFYGVNAFPALLK